jgi:hypothetical protein
MGNLRKSRAARVLVGLTAAATLAVGVAPTGFAQYGEEIVGGTGVTLGAPAPPGSPERKAQLKACIAKAKTKFGSNQVKKKKAIKKCKKKYG